MIKSLARATIADVARRAGVSKATVSRFLNHRETLLTPEIAARVEAAVMELGYIPSPMAQALKRGRSRLIGLVVADIANPYSVAVLRGAEQVCREAGYLVMLFNLGNEIERESAGIRALSSYQVEGFILNTMGHDTGAVLETARQGKPVVLVDRLHHGLEVDFVSLDNRQAVFDSARHLLEAGYGELLLVSEPLGTVSSRLERAEAFDAFLDEHSPAVAGQRFESEGDDSGGLLDALRALRSRAQARSNIAVSASGSASLAGQGHSFDESTAVVMPAIISSNAVVTLRIVAAVAQLGWRLGSDIGLVGIDDAEWAPYVGPGISAVAQPTGELGRLAAKCLIERLHGLDMPPRKSLLPGKLMIRGSSLQAPSRTIVV